MARVVLVDRDLDDVLSEITRIARWAVPGPDAPSITLIRGHKAFTAAYGSVGPGKFTDCVRVGPRPRRLRPGRPSSAGGIAAAFAVTAAVRTLALAERPQSPLVAYRPRTWGSKTIEHLLGHRSGIGDYLEESAGHQIDDYVMTVPVHQLADSNDYLKVLDEHPQHFTPGERFAYINAGFVLLAILSERATGTAFFVDVVQQRICTPAHMVDTADLRSDTLPELTARGYLHVEGHRSNVLHLPVRGSWRRRRVYDCRRHPSAVAGLLEATVLDHATFTAAWRPRSDVPAEGSRYGLGFWLHATGPGVMLEGSDAGVSFRTVHDRNSDTTHTVIANWSNGAWPVTRALDQMLLGW